MFRFSLLLHIGSLNGKINVYSPSYKVISISEPPLIAFLGDLRKEYSRALDRKVFGWRSLLRKICTKYINMINPK